MLELKSIPKFSHTNILEAIIIFFLQIFMAFGKEQKTRVYTWRVWFFATLPLFMENKIHTIQDSISNMIQFISLVELEWDF